MLNRLNGDVWTIESKDSGHQPLPHFAPYKGKLPKKVAVGFLNHRTVNVETPEEIAADVRHALSFLDAENLVLSSDCGFGRQGVPRPVAFYKAAALAQAANVVRRRARRSGASRARRRSEVAGRRARAGGRSVGEADRMRVTVRGEFVQEREEDDVRTIYPDGMHATIAAALRKRLPAASTVTTASLDQEDHGLPPATLDATDVLLWQAHLHHDDVRDEVVDRVIRRVLDGMGLVVLHSAMDSKPFQRLMGTSCHAVRWRKGTDREVVWTVNPAHPITRGLPPVFVIPTEEMYSEYFDIPQPEALVFISSFSGGEVFRSGCCFSRGKGRIFYFRPGHETHPVYHQPEVQQVVANAVSWAYADEPSLLDISPTDPMAREGKPGWYDGT